MTDQPVESVKTPAISGKYRGARPLMLVAVTFAAALTCMLAAGCGGKSLDLGTSTEKLDKEIALSSSKPLIVDFWKMGCASCMSLEPVIAKLSEEYDGQVTVGRFWMEHFWFEPTNWDVFKRYSFAFFPTVILFVNGKEVHRWVWVLEMNEYRKILDPLVGRTPTTRPDSTPPTAKPAQPK